MARVDTLKNFLKDIADKFREKLGTTETIAHAEYDTKIDEVYNKGIESEYDRFWNNFQNYGNRTDYSYGLGGIGWTDEIFPPKYPIKVTDTARMFQNSSVTNIPSIDCTHESFNNLNQMFYYATKAVTIGTVILKTDGSQTFNQTFNSCNALENITFEGVIGNSVSFVSSKSLTTESIDNIISHLKDCSQETTKPTITFHSTVVNNLTETQLETIRNKNWIVG